MPSDKNCAAVRCVSAGVSSTRTASRVATREASGTSLIPDAMGDYQVGSDFFYRYRWKGGAARKHADTSREPIGATSLETRCCESTPRCGQRSRPWPYRAPSNPPRQEPGRSTDPDGDPLTYAWDLNASFFPLGRKTCPLRNRGTSLGKKWFSHSLPIKPSAKRKLRPIRTDAAP
jgi:hypothetical protein